MKSKSGYFNDDTIDHFTHVAKYDGWEVMTKDIYRFVEVDCDWEDLSDKWHLVKVLMSEVGYELINN